jgi:hypothetical protein
MGIGPLAAISVSETDDKSQNAQYGVSDGYRCATKGHQMNPNPDYDASDELEYGIAAFAWLLRGHYPPPSYAPDLGGPDSN